MQYKKISFIPLVFLFSLFITARGQTNAPGEEGNLVHWLTFKEAFDQNKTQSKPFLIDVYTSWCGWCKHMMKTTYASPEIAQYINTWFYPVKFDAETKDSIEFLNKWYYNRNPNTKSTHELAVLLLGNKLMYPTTVFANFSSKFQMPYPGYLDAKKIEPALVYTVENVYNTSSFDDFNEGFEKTFYDTTAIKQKVKWHSFDEALKLQKKDKKKLLVFMHTTWCNACRVMYKTSFADSASYAYLSKKFYLVDFNVESNDSIQFNGNYFKGNLNNQAHFHQLALALTNNSLALPTTLIMDEQLKPIEAIPLYLNPSILNKIATFYGNDLYKTQQLKNYLEQQSHVK